MPVDDSGDLNDLPALGSGQPGPYRGLASSDGLDGGSAAQLLFDRRCASVGASAKTWRRISARLSGCYPVSGLGLSHPRSVGAQPAARISVSTLRRKKRGTSDEDCAQTAPLGTLGTAVAGAGASLLVDRGSDRSTLPRPSLAVLFFYFPDGVAGPTRQVVSRACGT